MHMIRCMLSLQIGVVPPNTLKPSKFTLRLLILVYSVEAQQTSWLLKPFVALFEIYTEFSEFAVSVSNLHFWVGLDNLISWKLKRKSRSRANGDDARKFGGDEWWRLAQAASQLEPVSTTWLFYCPCYNSVIWIACIAVIDDDWTGIKICSKQYELSTVLIVQITCRLVSFSWKLILKSASECECGGQFRRHCLLVLRCGV